MQKTKFDKYLNARMNYPPFIEESPKRELCIIVTIPLYKEENVLSTLESLYDTKLGHDKFEIILVVNQSAEADRISKEINQLCIEQIKSYRSTLELTNLHLIFLAAVESNKAGVGHARKTAMDEASRRLLSINRPDGLISCMDGDAIVGKDYLECCYQLYLTKGEDDFGYSFNFAHPLENGYSDQKDAIIAYELHLRYFKHALSWAGHPHSIYTVGSSMACRVSGYIKQGGMNERKAGEDFYFLQKFSKAGRFRWEKSITVYPSARPSDRVPFGTGRAMIEFENKGMLSTYDFNSIIAIHSWIERLKEAYSEKSLDALTQQASILSYFETIASSLFGLMPSRR
jgi:hypothetical protein